MEQLGDFNALYNSEKEKNLLLERKLTACIKIMQKHTKEIESYKNLEHSAQITKEKDREIKWLYEELGRLGISETISNYLKIEKSCKTQFIEKNISTPDEGKINLLSKVKGYDTDIRVKKIKKNFIINEGSIKVKMDMLGK